MAKTITSVVVLLTLLNVAPPSLAAQVKKETMSKKPSRQRRDKLQPQSTAESYTIHQEVDFTASPERIYRALLDSKQFSEFTAAQAGGFSPRSATIDPGEGGTFTLFDGYITGCNVELVPNRRIVQAWHDKEWPAGVYSLVKFELQPQGTGTRLVFDHTGFPPRSHDHLAEGWKANYWEPMKEYFKGKK